MRSASSALLSLPREIKGGHLDIDLPVLRQKGELGDVLLLKAESFPERNRIRDGRGEPVDGTGWLSGVIGLCVLRNEIAGSNLAKRGSPTRNAALGTRKNRVLVQLGRHRADAVPCLGVLAYDAHRGAVDDRVDYSLLSTF
jgi:hypothetical protein